MESITQNWLWILFGIFFVGMHMFGHGGHGGHGGHVGHGGHGGHNSSDHTGAEDADSDDRSPKKSSGHQH